MDQQPAAAGGGVATRVRLEADMPDDELEDFLVTVREWEGGRSHVQMGILIQADITVRAAEDILAALEPPVPLRKRAKAH